MPAQGGSRRTRAPAQVKGHASMRCNNTVGAHRFKRSGKTGRWLLLAAAAVLAVAGCTTAVQPAADSSSSPQKPSDSAAAGSSEQHAAGDDAALAEVSFALDWAPNTNHVGVYVAQELGYFTEAGLDVTILPYGSTTVAQLVSAGQADFGIAGQSNVQMART